MVPTDMGEN